MTTEAHPGGRSRRILVAITAPRRSRHMLAAAAALARRMHAELEALFVEDAELLGVADLPVTHEIDLAGGGIRALDSGRLARAMRAEAQLLRHEIAALDSGGESPWRVRVVRGR
ncbi:MAG: hypothetical protein R3286_17655, partial [Gammaproteobacteria bacterium]|nr:hypothetical protein [Gammaproteobacteria bacterium]